MNVTNGNPIEGAAGDVQIRILADAQGRAYLRAVHQATYPKEE